MRARSHEWHSRKSPEPTRPLYPPCRSTLPTRPISLPPRFIRRGKGRGAKTRRRRRGYGVLRRTAAHVQRRSPTRTYVNFAFSLPRETTFNYIDVAPLRAHAHSRAQTYTLYKYNAYFIRARVSRSFSVSRSRRVDPTVFRHGQYRPSVLLNVVYVLRDRRCRNYTPEFLHSRARARYHKGSRFTEGRDDRFARVSRSTRDRSELSAAPAWVASTIVLIKRPHDTTRTSPSHARLGSAASGV